MELFTRDGSGGDDIALVDHPPISCSDAGAGVGDPRARTCGRVPSPSGSTGVRIYVTKVSFSSTARTANPESLMRIVAIGRDSGELSRTFRSGFVELCN
jgi:hypothetical protein